jgi:hypothetical protein
MRVISLLFCWRFEVTNVIRLMTNMTSPAWYCRVLSVYNRSIRPKIGFGCLDLDGNGCEQCRTFVLQ